MHLIKRFLGLIVAASLAFVTPVFAANEVQKKTGTSFVWANSTYSSSVAACTLGTYSATFDIDVDGLTTGQARESLKADLGVNRSMWFSVDLSAEYATDPISGETIDLYWSESGSATAGTDNAAQTTGADADFAGSATLSLGESLKQMVFIGSFVLGDNNTADGLQCGHVGVFSPNQRYGALIYHNNTSDSMHSDSVEMAVRFTPFTPEIQ